MESDWQNSVFLIICDSAMARLGDEWGFGRVAGVTYFDETCSRVIRSHMAYYQLILQFTIIIYAIQVSVILSIFAFYNLKAKSFIITMGHNESRCEYTEGTMLSIPLQTPQSLQQHCYNSVHPSGIIMSRCDRAKNFE
jgi:hypothetical protein